MEYMTMENKADIIWICNLYEAEGVIFSIFR